MIVRFFYPYKYRGFSLKRFHTRGIISFLLYFNRFPSYFHSIRWQNFLSFSRSFRFLYKKFLLLKFILFLCA